MTDREKLIELIISSGQVSGFARGLADHLIANGVTVQKWIPVTERLPESEKCVLIYSKDGKVAEGKYNARFNEWTQFRWNVTEVRNVTHWMPKPQPPKDE